MASQQNATGAELHENGLQNLTISHSWSINFPSFAICAPGYCSDFALWLSYGVQIAAAIAQLTHVLLFLCTSVLQNQQSALVVLLQLVLLVENPQMMYLIYPSFESNCVIGWLQLVYLPSLTAFLMQVIVFDIMMTLINADSSPSNSLKRGSGSCCKCFGYSTYVLLAALIIPGLGIAIEYVNQLVPATMLTPQVLRTLRAVLLSTVLTYTILTITIMLVVICRFLCCNQRRMRKHMAIRSSVILVRQNLLSLCLIICLVGTFSNVALIVRPFYCDYDLTRFTRSGLGIAIALAFACSPQTRHSLAARCYACCERSPIESVGDAEEMQMDSEDKQIDELDNGKPGEANEA